MKIIRLKHPIDLREYIFVNGALLPLADVQHLFPIHKDAPKLELVGYRKG